MPTRRDRSRFLKGIIMTTTAIFDTLEVARRLQPVFNRDQAEALTRALNEVALTNVATKNDVKDAVHTLTVRIGSAIVVGLTLATTILGAIITLN